MPLYLFVLLPIVAGLISYGIGAKARPFFLIAFQLGLVAFTVYIFMKVGENGFVLWNAVGYQDGLALSLYADTVGIFLVLITSILFLFFLIFASGEKYFDSKFTFLYLVLQGLMNGLFLSSDLFNIFIFLEVATVVVAILIMINKEKQAIYDGMIYFFVNVIGTSFLLFGIGMIYNTFGLLDIRYIKQAMTQLNDPRAMIIPFAMMMVTVSLKTAVIPLFSWLPRAHGTPSAPPVVSALLSGLYIKTGVYLFIRFADMYSPVIDMKEFFFVIGLLTSIVGFIMALGQHDIKLILAYHTVSQIGLIMIGLNMGAEIAFWGAVLHIFNHAIFKSTLFLTAGVIYDAYGTRDVYQIRGVLKTMPMVGIATLLSVLGIMGAPFFNASVSKYMIMHGTSDYTVKLLLNLINLGTIASFVKYATMLFGKPRSSETIKVKNSMQLTTLILGLASLLTGVFAIPLSQFLLNYNFTIDMTEYNVKTLTFVLMVIAAVGFYNGVVKNGGLLECIGHIELTFNGIITAMVSYLLVIILFTTIMM